MDLTELLARLKGAVAQTWRYISFFTRTYRGWLVGGATILSVLLIVWARFGFTLQVSQFFAANNVDPTGNCVWKTNFNAPNGAWFCKSLQCNLIGNPSGGQEYPPEGPATQLIVTVFRTIVQTPATGESMHIRTVLDATPKCANGKECYPPKDPLWTCTGPMYQGRNGSDFYDCYDPIIHRTGSGPITCCANTGIGTGDCFTWNEEGTQVSPTPTPTPTPSPSITPQALQCQPTQQAVQTGQAATFQAIGSGPFSWSAEPDGTIVSGATDMTTSEQMQFIFSLPGEKKVKVTSGGVSATCRVTVTAAVQQPAAQLDIAVRNATTNTAFAQSVTIAPLQTGEVRMVITPTRAIANLIIRATFPNVLSYVPGSTFVDGAGVPDALTTGGLNLGNIGPAGTSGSNAAARTITTRVKAGAAAGYAVGVTQTPVRIELFSGTEPLAVTGNAQFAVQHSGTGQVGQVQTGPGETALLAFIVSALVALLYVSYTRSPLFRERQVKDLSQDKDTIDFRG